jgi:hypothetical protein
LEKKFSVWTIHEEDGVASTNFIAIEHAEIVIFQCVDEFVGKVDHQIEVFPAEMNEDRFASSWVGSDGLRRVEVVAEVCQNIPQGLKPGCCGGGNGTAEAVPLRFLLVRSSLVVLMDRAYSPLVLVDVLPRASP